MAAFLLLLQLACCCLLLLQLACCCLLLLLQLACCHACCACLLRVPTAVALHTSLVAGRVAAAQWSNS